MLDISWIFFLRICIVSPSYLLRFVRSEAVLLGNSISEAALSHFKYYPTYRRRIRIIASYPHISMATDTAKLTSNKVLVFDVYGTLVVSSTFRLSAFRNPKHDHA